jgi:peptidoglycan/xylan/chitin deacetylase (PgdA/CDA1 family)
MRLREALCRQHAEAATRPPSCGRLALPTDASSACLQLRERCRAILTLYFLLLAQAASTARPADIPPRRPAVAAALRPPTANELGLVPIVMYHSVGERSGSRRLTYDRRGLNISPATFRKQLALMHRAGWYPVNLRDLMSARVDIPVGKTPVVLTFDDARASQFRMLPNGSVDPECAVAILEAFAANHPDWPARATFFVLPASAYNPAPFGQAKLAARKIRYLVDRGYEVANHSLSHGWMDRMSESRLRDEVAGAIARIRKLDGRATMDTFAYPYGAAPRSARLREAVRLGERKGLPYQNRCMVIAWGGPAHPYAHKGLDLDRVPRIGVAPGELEAAVRALNERTRYISDGNPAQLTVWRTDARFLSPERADDVRVAWVGPDVEPARARRSRPTPKEPLPVSRRRQRASS